MRRSVVLPVPRERAWRGVLEPDWLADDRPRVEEEREEQRRLTWRWGEGAEESLVELTLDDDPEGTRVTVIEILTDDLPEAPDAVPVGLSARMPRSGGRRTPAAVPAAVSRSGGRTPGAVPAAVPRSGGGRRTPASVPAAVPCWDGEASPPPAPRALALA